MVQNYKDWTHGLVDSWAHTLSLFEFYYKNAEKALQNWTRVLFLLIATNNDVLFTIPRCTKRKILYIQ